MFESILTYYALHGAVFFWSQLGLTVISVVAHFMMQSLDHKTKKWGIVVGLVGQPFWFVFAYSTEAWLLFCTCILYAISWIQGFMNYWVRGSSL